MIFGSILTTLGEKVKMFRIRLRKKVKGIRGERLGIQGEGGDNNSNVIIDSPYQRE